MTLSGMVIMTARLESDFQGFLRSSRATAAAGGPPLTVDPMLPSGLSMLWESVEPEVALEERFGFTGVAAVVAWATTVLDQTWGIAVSGCSRMVISGHNVIAWFGSDRGDLVVKWCHAREHFASLDASTRLLSTLAERGLPVAAPISTVDGQARAVVDGPSGVLSLAVLPELAGDWLDVTDRAAVLSVGACLARVHRELGALEDTAVDSAVPPAGLGEQVRDWLASGDRGLAPEGSRRLADLLSRAPRLDDRPQLVHNDFRAANLLVRDSEVVGVLDFDEVMVEHRVVDLAKASVYLATRFTDWGPTTPEVRGWLRAGYESVRPLSPAEARWLEIFVLWRGIQAIPGDDDAAGWATEI